MERGKPWLKNQGERGVTTVEGFVMKLEEQTTVRQRRRESRMR